MKKRIAILGATSHIAKGLIFNFSRHTTDELYLFARSAQRVKDFLATICTCENYIIKPIDGFGKDSYDVIMNCIGIGNPASLRTAATPVFELMETYDNKILAYLQNHKKSLYINFSSGAVYGTDFSQPAGNNSKNSININAIDPSIYYSVAKLNSEAKHRYYQNLRIIDLRVFAYFSRFIDLKTQYLITEIINAIRNRNTFITGNSNIVRDYVGHEDLFSLVCACMEKPDNDSYDVYSRKPVGKFEILKSFRHEFGLNFKISRTLNFSSATGTKNYYYSVNKKANKLGYKPKYTSLKLLISETKAIMELRGLS